MEGSMDGEAPKRICPRCAAEVLDDAAFCPRCGLPLNRTDDVARQYAFYAPPPRPVREKSSLQAAREVVRGIGAYMVLVVLALVTINVGIMLWGMQFVIPEAWESGTALFLVLPWIVKIVGLPGVWFVTYYILLVAAVLLSYAVMLFLSGKRFWKELTFKPTEHSPAYAVSTIFLAILAMNAAYYLLLGFLGVDPSSGGDTGLLWEKLWSLLRASVWEEIICRILYIGLPLGVVYALKGKGAPYRRYILGGNFQFGPWEKFFLVFSSAIFSLAHVFSWDLYKVPPTFLAGLALGYLFLKYGVYASVMLHFFIDYLSFPMDVWPGDGTDMIMGLLMLAFMALGAVYLVYYAIRALELFSGRQIMKWGDPRPVSVYYQPLSPKAKYVPYDGPLTSPSFGFVCKHCAGTEARFVDGKFICSRCGKEN